MADAQANINVNLDTSDALAQLKILQRQISSFHQAMAIGGAKARAESAQLSQTLINTVNSSGKFSASIQRTLSTTESFTNALERNKLSMTQYFRFGVGASKNFGKVFRSEFATIDKVARERVKTLQTQYIQLGRDANGAMQSIAVRPLSLDMKNLGTQVMMTAQRQQIFNQLLKQGSTNLLNFGKNTQWAGRQLMVGFTIPLSIMGATAGREFMKLEEQAVKFRRVYGDMFTTSADTEKALDNVRELADEFTKYGIAVEKTLDLAAKVAQMGNMGDALEAQVTQATRLAVLGGLEQQEALDTTISLTNAFGVSTEDLAGKIAFLNAAENQTILAIEDFNEAIPKAGSVVKQLGGDVEDLAFFLTAMREGGINASRGANALKSSLGRLINPTDVAREKLGEFGIDILSIVESNAGNLREMVLELGYELDRLDPLDRARAIEQLFGKFQFARMSTMFQNIVKDGTQARKVLDLTSQTTEELGIIAERELSRVEESVSFKFQKQIEKLQAALAPIGGEFIKAVTPLLEGVTKILKAFNGMSDGAKQFAVIAVAAVGVIAPTFLMLFGLVANGFANFIKGITKVFGGLGMLAGRSQMVGGSMAYMTQEQLEAQAVSSSLQQTHQTLTQTFTSEVGAVNTLAAAYEAAIQKLQRFNAAAASTAATTGAATGAAAAGGAAGTSRYSPFMPPKKYNKGVVMVPGPKGKGDIIPAMLTPGEAVIPAEETKKYLPLIKGIVSDSLPGYAESNIPGVSRIAERIAPGASGSSSTAITKTLEKEALGRAQGLAIAAGESATEAVNYVGQAVEELGNSLRNVGDKIISTKKDLETDPAFQESRQERIRSQKAAPQAAHLGPQGKTVSTTEFSEVAPGRSNVAAVARLEEVSGRTYDVSQKHSFVKENMPGWMNAEMGLGTEEVASITGRGDLVGTSGQEVYDFFEGQTEDDVMGSYSEALQSTGESPDNAELRADILAFDAELTRLIGERVEQRLVDSEEQIAAMPQSEQGKYVSLESLESQAAQNVFEDPNQPRPAGKRFREVALETPREGRFSKKTVKQIASDAEKFGPQLSPEDQKSLDYFKTKAKGNKPVQVDVSQKDRQAARQRVASVGRSDGQAMVEELIDGAEQVAPQIVPSILDAGGWQSPHPMYGQQGFEDGSEYGQQFAQGATAGAEGNLQPPPAPTPGTGGTGKQGIRTRIGGFVSSGVERFSQTKLGQRAGEKLSGMSGIALSDNQGNIVYDPNQDPNTWAGKMEEANKRVSSSVDELTGNLQEADAQIDNYSQSVEQSGDAAQQAGQQQDMAPDPRTGEMIPRAQADKIARRENRRQKRQARAGRALGGFGAATGALAAATQVNVEVPGIGNIGEFAQKLLPVTGALMAVAPVLLALPLPIAALVAVIGAGVYLWMRHNKKLKEATENARKLAVGLGSGSDAIQKFAEAAGTVSATELMNERRQIGSLPIAAGRSEFGESFISGEAGQEYVRTVEEGIAELGRSEVMDKLGLQLATAVASNVLTKEQAAGIAVEVGRAVGDLSLGIGVAAEVSKFIGPNGEEEPLPVEVFAKIIEASTEDVKETLDDLIAKTLDEDAFTGFFNFDKETLQAEFAAGVLAQAEQVQQAIDAQQVATDKRVKALQEEGRQLAANGKQEEANAKFEEARTVQEEGDQQRIELLTKQQELLEETTGEMFKIAEAAKIAQPEIGAAIESFNLSDQKTPMSEAIEQQLRQSLQAIEDLEGVDFGDVDTMSQSELVDAYSEADPYLEDLNKKQETLNGSLEQMGEILKERLGEDSAAFEKIDQIIKNGDLDFDLKYNLVVGLGAGSLDINNIQDFLDTTALTDVEEITQEQINEFISGLDTEEARKFMDMSTDEIKEYIANFNQETQDAFSNIQTSLGAGAAQTLSQIFGNLDDDQLAREFTLKVNTLVEDDKAEEAQELLDTLGQLSAYDAGPITAEVIFQTYLDDPDAFEAIKLQIEEIEGFFAEQAGPDGKVTYDQVISQNIIKDEGALAAFKGDAEYFNNLDPFQQFLYLQTLLTVEDTLDLDEFNAWLAKNDSWARNLQEGRVTTDQATAAYIRSTARDVVGNPLNLNQNDDDDDDDDITTGGGGGQDPTSFLDDIVKQYRDFSDSSQELTKGFDASLAAIMEFAQGGAWGLNGLSRQLRNVNVSETLIDKFLGMDPEEWEKIKPRLFQVDEASGQITGLTAEGEAVQQAEAAGTIAAEKDTIDEQVESAEDQIKAYDKLIAQGASVETASKLIENAKLAEAIATRSNTKEIRDLIKAQEDLQELEEEIAEINEEEQRKERIREAVQKMNEEFEEQVKALNKVRAATDKYTDAQINAIFGNKDLRSLFLEPEIDRAALQKALDNAEKQVQLELDIKLLTFEGREDFLSEAFTKAKERLSAEEKRIGIAFDLEVAGQEKVITEAQNEIDSLTYMIDDYQAQLDEIQYREDAINEKYDKRTEALDKIANINDRIAAQQKSQLDLAEALSRGDIAAAAQAAQSAREQESRDNLEAQREMMDQRRQAELDSIKSLGGLTREQIQDQIDILNRKVTQIEEARLEPAEEYIRLAQIRKDTEIENLEVLGKTSQQWDLIQNNLDIARTRNYEFMNDMQKQFNMYPEVLQKYLAGEPLPPPPALPKPPPPPRRQQDNTPSKWEGGIVRRGGKRYSREDPRGRGGHSMAFGGLVARMATGGYMKGGMFTNMAVGGPVPYKGKGGSSTRMSMGGIVPSYMAMGGMPLGSDLIPAMLTPGEFVVRRPAVSSYGVDRLENINRGTHNDGSVYNYNLAVNVKSDSNPDQIANTVMREIKRIDSQRIRNNRY